MDSPVENYKYKFTLEIIGLESVIKGVLVGMGMNECRRTRG